MPLFESCNAVIQFGSYLKTVIDYFIAKLFNDKYSKSTSKNIKDLLEKCKRY